MPDFHGRPTGVLENSHVRLEYLTEGGPRIVRLSAANSENILGESVDIGWDTPAGYFELLGGHRLWAAPEVSGVSYLPDSTGLVVEELHQGPRLAWAPNGPGLSKNIEVSLSSTAPEVRIRHEIVNRFERPVRIGVWGITVFPLGGTAYVPAPATNDGLLPDRSMQLWPYSRWDDARLELRADGICVHGQSAMPPIKIGTFVASGTCAYLRNGSLLVKRFDVPPGEYPDRGTNVEVYCSDRFIELETLAPLTELAAGEAAAAEETWEIHTGEQAMQRLTELFPMGGTP